MLITGAESGCGKSYIAANFSRTLAGEGRRVVTRRRRPAPADPARDLRRARSPPA